MLSLVVQDMQFGGVEIGCARPVANEGVIVPTVPKSLNDLDEFLGARVAIGVLEMVLAGEVAAFVQVG